MSELPVPNPSDQPPTGVDPSVEPDAARWRRSIRVSGSGGGFVYRVGELIVDTDATDLVAQLGGQPARGGTTIAGPSLAR